MNQNLTIVAKIEASADQIALVKAELKKLVAPTLKEAGCVRYDLHQDNENPAIFLFYEVWESRELWRDHIGNTHLAEFKAATEGAVVSTTLNEMSTL